MYKSQGGKTCEVFILHRQNKVVKMFFWAVTKTCSQNIMAVSPEAWISQRLTAAPLVPNFPSTFLRVDGVRPCSGGLLLHIDPHSRHLLIVLLASAWKEDGSGSLGADTAPCHWVLHQLTHFLRTLPPEHAARAVLLMLLLGQCRTG